MEQRQSSEGLRGSGTRVVEEVMHHERLQEKILNVTILVSLSKFQELKVLCSFYSKCGETVLPQERQQWE